MCKHAKMNFNPLRPAGLASQRRSQSSLESRDAALGLGTLAILELRETAVHLATILGLCPATSATLVQVDDRTADAQRSRIDMIVFGIVAGVREQLIDADPSACAAQHGSQQRRVLAGTV